MAASDNEPLVYAYLDFRRWLEDWFLWRRAKNPRYSYRRFSQVSGLAVGTLHNILTGRRSPSAESIARIARSVPLTGEEEAFLSEEVLRDDSVITNYFGG